ncbi:MAG: hypothetical protein Q9227_008965 [Pyrenula ochraceoflavens]
MGRLWGATLSCILLHALCCAAQFPASISNDSDIQRIKSPVDGNITISYKTPPAGTCLTIFPTQKQYTGYVTLPPYTLSGFQQNYTINTFFWFVEARQAPEAAPLTLYLNGGPGSSSMVGLFQEVGPCEVVEVAKNQLGTRARDWGWDRSSNLLFMDQPDQTGFSYDTVTKGSMNFLNSTISTPPANAPADQASNTFVDGSFSSGDPLFTTNTSNTAAQAAWHFLQGFLGTFPQYNTGSSQGSATPATVGINLFTESYGGHYGPAFASFFETQNQLRSIGTLPSNTTLNVELSSLGIIQGCIDYLIQGPFYPKFAYNNTYNIQAISLIDQQTAADAFLSADGCQQLIISCRAAASNLDPSNIGDAKAVNDKCSEAWTSCNNNVVMGTYQNSGRSWYDISQSTFDPFPADTFLEYLNTPTVQAALGVPINYTTFSNPVLNAFEDTGDYVKGDQVSSLAYLLTQGIRVALIYGDRDYACNWLGGEAISFSVAGSLPSYSNFYAAGYAPIVTNQSYIGGVVRQYGNLSFSRIYDAGHLVPAYQPETAFTLFTRIITGKDLSNGLPVSLNGFLTTGEANATYTNVAPAMAEPVCYLRDVPDTCDSEQTEALRNGEGVVINGVWYKEASDWKAPPASLSSEAGLPGTMPTSSGKGPGATPARGGGGRGDTTTATGVYVATTTPKMTTSSKSGYAAPMMTQGLDGMVVMSLVTVILLGV